MGDPIELPLTIWRGMAIILIVVVALWNGWALWLTARQRTALLPGGSTGTMLDRGPFTVSRNPLSPGLSRVVS